MSNVPDLQVLWMDKGRRKSRVLSKSVLENVANCGFLDHSAIQHLAALHGNRQVDTRTSEERSDLPQDLLSKCR